ncbi:MAG: amidohydrolase family protein [Chloroflexota bacterium]
MIADQTELTNSETKSYNLIDCDVHHILPSFDKLMEYLEPGLCKRIELATNAKSEARNAFRMPRRAYFNPTSTARVDTMDEDGTNHASVPQRVKEDLLDRYDITYAILMGNDLTTISGMPDPDLAAGICRAYNDWTNAEWINYDSRFKHSIWVTPQDPQQAADEIHRWGNDPNVVQVGIGQMDILAGKRHYWPIYEAAAQYNLPVGFHVGAESAGLNGAQTAVGAPTHYIELQTGVISIGIQNTISLVCEGVFSKFPNLKVALLEYGWTWLPGLMWRLDREWMSFRQEVPWVTKPPSDYIKEHIRVGSQPLEAPSKEHLHQTLEMMSADKMMLFATDYPHWDFDDPNYVLRKLPKHMRTAIAYENARELYGL